MSCSRILRPVAVVLTTESTTAAFEPMTEWIPVTGLDTVDFALNILSQDGAGTIECIPGAQMSEVRTDRPGAPGAITGTWVTSEATHHFSDTPSGASNFFVRFGVSYRLTSGTSLGAAQVKLSVAVNRCGKVLPGKELEVMPYMTVTDKTYIPISGWEPTVALSKLKAAFLVMDNANTDLEYALACRTANDPAEPNSWQDAETFANPGTGNSARNTGEVSVPAGANLSSNHLIQLAVAVKAKTGGTNPRATVRVVGALKY